MHSPIHSTTVDPSGRKGIVIQLRNLFGVSDSYFPVYRWDRWNPTVDLGLYSSRNHAVPKRQKCRCSLASSKRNNS